MTFRIGHVVPLAGARHDDPPVTPPLGHLPVTVNPAHEGRPQVALIGLCRPVAATGVAGGVVWPLPAWQVHGWRFVGVRALLMFGGGRPVSLAGWPLADLARLDAGRFN